MVCYEEKNSGLVIFLALFMTTSIYAAENSPP
jgi:hypothetical protein